MDHPRSLPVYTATTGVFFFQCKEPHGKSPRAVAPVDDLRIDEQILPFISPNHSFRDSLNPYSVFIPSPDTFWHNAANYSFENVMYVRFLVRLSGQSFLLFQLSLILAEAFQLLKCSTFDQSVTVCGR
jgi:hypothetical protein